MPVEHGRLQRSQFGIARNGPRCQPSRAGDGCGISSRIETQQMRGQEAALRESHGNHRPSGGNMLRNPCINGLGGLSRLLVQRSALRHTLMRPRAEPRISHAIGDGCLQTGVISRTGTAIVQQIGQIVFIGSPAVQQHEHRGGFRTGQTGQSFGNLHSLSVSTV